MADEISPSSNPQAPFPEASSNHPSKYYGHFPFKTAFVTIFLVLLPLFQCEILNQSVNATSWELLQLIFVGIAVSYGLFSKKSDEIEDHGLKLDNTQSYVSKLLQVSSVFDDESENETLIDENRVQTWNSQYYRGEPVVVVSNENPNFKEENGVTAGISKKSLLLPVRSLRQRVPDPIESDLVDGNLLKRSNSNSSSKGLCTNLSIPKNGEFGGRISQKEEMEEKTEDNVVLPSPIPWRSRSGRMEMERNGNNPEFRLQAGSLNSNPSSKYISPSSSLSSPQKLSNSATFSIESQAKNSEDVARKFSSTSPSPPFPQIYLKKSNSSGMSNSVSSEKKFRRSVRSLPTEELSDSEIEELYERINPSSEWRGRMVNDDLLKSVRTFQSSEPVTEAEKMSFDHDTMFVEEKGYLEEKNGLLEKILMENSDDEDSDAEIEDCDLVGSLGNGEAVDSDNGNDLVPDVDKKADEFIAKFREQIGLQRINSIRKSKALKT